MLLIAATQQAAVPRRCPVKQAVSRQADGYVCPKARWRACVRAWFPLLSSSAFRMCWWCAAVADARIDKVGLLVLVLEGRASRRLCAAAAEGSLAAAAIVAPAVALAAAFGKEFSDHAHLVMCES